ncbi:MAG: hypothetical protein ACXVPN_15425 [Bacteroidia bacterium]
MRFLPFKIIAWSWLGITLTLRRFFFMLFILSAGLAIGILTGLYKKIKELNEDDATFILTLGIIIPVSLVLWIIFFSVHRAHRNKEGMHYMVEYLEELRDKGVITEENFLKEKQKITEDYK